MLLKIEIVDPIECIVDYCPSSMRYKTSCGVKGGQDKNNVFSIVAMVWCMHLHIALD